MKHPYFNGKSFKKLNPKYFLSGFLLAGIFILNFLPAIYADNSIDLTVKELLQQMTLEEKIGQMTQVDIKAIFDTDDIRKYNLGSLLSGGDSTPTGTTPARMADMIDSYQAAALKTRLKIPLIYGIDAVHGYNSIVNTVVFPHNIGMGATGDPELVEKAARITAIEAAGTGVKWTFAPCVAVARDERWGRTYESYGETPDLPVLLGTAAVRGFQGADLHNTDSILACAKHYVGDGGTRYGTGIYGGNDRGYTQVSEAGLRALFLPPYISAVKAGVRTVMVSYSSWNGENMHGHQYLITEVLKGELGFDGFVVSDWQGYQNLSGNLADQIAAAYNAGIDMMMVPSGYQRFIGTAKELVENGRIPLSRVDDAVSRILKVKYELGLFDHSYADRELTKTIGSTGHREVARECVRKSLVLLKNESKTLPLSKDLKRIIVAGKCADNLGYQCGGWTVTWQGSRGNITAGTTILQGIRNAVSPQTEVSYSPNGKPDGEADVAIVAVGETPYAEYNGDIIDPATLELGEEDQTTIRNIEKMGIPMVIILISGRPMIITKELNRSKAFIAAWLPGTEGQGIADILFGDYHPVGKLPCSWPRNMKQIPINVGDKDYDPLFKYGYGLSY